LRGGLHFSPVIHQALRKVSYIVVQRPGVADTLCATRQFCLVRLALGHACPAPEQATGWLDFADAHHVHIR
jgi:hypothetical protein